jgi:membrane protein YqaA with SNARE-associated domain
MDFLLGAIVGYVLGHFFSEQVTAVAKKAWETIKSKQDATPKS